MIKTGIFSKFRKKELRSETENTVTVDFMRDLITGVLTRESTLNIPTVAGCISKISETVSRLPIKLYQKNDDKITEISDDSRLVLLNGETGDTLNSVEMWRAVIEDYFVGRGGWIYINSDGMRVKSLNYVDSRNISLMKNTDPIFKAYDITVNGRKYYDFQFVKILRKTRDGCTNIPMQEEYYQIFSAVFNALKLENLMSKNGGCKPGFLKSKVRLAQATIDNIKQNYANVYDNEQTDKVVVLNDGIDFQPISSTAAELQLNENKRVNSMEICKLFGFPHSVIDGNATPDDNKKFISAVIALLNQIETALDISLLLETEKEQGFYFAFDTKELTRGDIKERYAAYDIAVRNNILQIDEIRKEEDYEPLGFNYMKLGLSDVLYDPKTDHVFVPNTGQTTDMKTGSEVRARQYIQLPNGKMNGNKSVGGGGSSGSSGTKGVDKSGESGIIKAEDVSATGKNELRKKGFPSKQKLNNHWQNGRTHADEYKPEGITTKEQYEKRGVELAESAADGKKILGYKTKEGLICRYDVEKNDYVKADINKGLRTLFKPNEGIDYYYDKKKKEGVE